MNKRFSYDNITKSHSIDPNDLIRVYKLDRCCDFMEEKFNNPNLTQKEICKRLGFSDSTIKRYRGDIQMNSPYRRKNNKKKTPKQNPTHITESISKNESSKNKKRPKNEIKGGNISDSHTLTGRELLDQTFKVIKQTLF